MIKLGRQIVNVKRPVVRRQGQIAVLVFGATMEISRSPMPSEQSAGQGAGSTTTPMGPLEVSLRPWARASVGAAATATHILAVEGWVQGTVATEARIALSPAMQMLARHLQPRLTI